MREFLSLDEVNSGLAIFPFHVLLMRLPCVETDQVSSILRVRERFPAAGLVTVANEIEPSARFQMREIKGHRLIDEPVELDDLAPIVEKLVKGENGHPRLHPRISREGDAEVLDVRTHTMAGAKFVDFAQMGARILVQTPTPLTRMQRIQVHYNSSSDPGRKHRIEALVVWEKVTSGIFRTVVSGPQQMVGVRFIAAL